MTTKKKVIMQDHAYLVYTQEGIREDKDLTGQIIKISDVPGFTKFLLVRTDTSEKQLDRLVSSVDWDE